MSNDTKAQQLQLEHWMRDLPEQLKDVPLIYLAIPGIRFSFYFLQQRALCTMQFAFNQADITFLRSLLNWFRL